MTGNTEFLDLKLKAGASPSVVDNMVIKPAVKLRESNIKLFQLTHHFTLETENVKIYDITKKNDLMAAIYSLNRLICYKEWRKYQTCHVVSSFNCLIK